MPTYEVIPLVIFSYMLGGWSRFDWMRFLDKMMVKHRVKKIKSETEIARFMRNL